MKNYIKPSIEITNLNNEDVITVSGGLVLTKFTAADDTKKYNVINNF
ncbi:MAG: hypothetical protein ACI4VF_05120 [Lachnospirales bacterium]